MQSKSLRPLLSALCLLGIGSRNIQAAVFNEVDGRVVVEAEHFDKRVVGATHRYLVVPDEDAGTQSFSGVRGDKYVQVLPDSGENRNANASVVGTGATIEYKVQISTTGEYQLFMRGLGWDGSADSYYVQIVEISSPAWYRYSPNPTGTDFSLLRNNNDDANTAIGWNGYATPETNGGDGSEVPALYTISKAGIYTIRISQREDGTAIDAFILQRTNLPLPDDPGPPESPTIVVTLQPLAVTAVVPSADIKDARFDASIQVILADGTTTLAANSIVLQLDGATVTPTVTADAGTTTAKYQPPSIFRPNSAHSATVTYADTTGAQFTKTWAFTVQNYILIAASSAVTPDRTRPGFLVRTWKSLGQPNTLAWTEEQLAGLHGANEADTSTFTDKQYGNSYFAEDGPINYWNSEGQGNFTNNGTQNTPGLANDGTDDDNYSLEVITYLDLPAGVITMGVNSDDGFRVTTFSGDPRGPSAVTLGQFDGGRATAATRFQFVVERAGAYPFRLIYEEGTGGSAVEWFAVRTDNTLHLINDANDTVSIKAYRPVAPPVTSVGKFSSAKLSGNNIVIEWTGGGTLQSADDITGPWSDIAGATSPRTVPPSGTRKFYRLKQ